MSTSEKELLMSAELGAILDRLEQIVDATLEGAEVFEPGLAADAVRLLALASRLYGGLSRTDGAEAMPMGIPVTTTDAATTASVLILSQNLSLFEFNIWYSRVADAAERQQQGAETK